MNRPYAMAANINRAFRSMAGARASVACNRRRSGRIADAHIPTDDGGVDLKCPTEIAISDRSRSRAGEVGTDSADSPPRTPTVPPSSVLSRFSAKAYQNNRRDGLGNLSSVLPYMFACCRFAHYLKVMVRDKVGSYYESEQFNAGSATGSVSTSMLIRRTPRKPPSAAGLLRRANLDHGERREPGYYAATFELRPHFQLEGMDIGCRLSPMPVAKKPSFRLNPIRERQPRARLSLK